MGKADGFSERKRGRNQILERVGRVALVWMGGSDLDEEKGGGGGGGDE